MKTSRLFSSSKPCTRTRTHTHRHLPNQVGDVCTMACRSHSMTSFFLVGTVVARIVVKRGSFGAHILEPEDVAEIAQQCEAHIRALTDAPVIKLPPTLFAEACNYDLSTWERIAERALTSVSEAQKMILRLSWRSRQSMERLIDLLTNPMSHTQSLHMPHEFGTMLEDDIMNEWLLSQLHTLVKRTKCARGHACIISHMRSRLHIALGPILRPGAVAALRAAPQTVSRPCTRGHACPAG